MCMHSDTCSQGTGGRFVSTGRRLLAVADVLPVVALAVIARTGSFTHIRDTGVGAV